MEDPAQISIECVDTLTPREQQDWNTLVGGHVFLQHDFLDAMHRTGCASKATGWSPLYLLLKRNGVLAGAMLLYLKTHSRGEYVFDQSWAEAYYQHQQHYYPKLVASVPFTPITGPRLLAHNDADRQLLAQAAAALAQQLKVSSVHVLFADPASVSALRSAGFMERYSVQFHWSNENYPDFPTFLAALQRDKRKKLQQSRRKLEQAGITFRWLTGTQIDTTQMNFFYRCYQNTYAEHFSSPYLTFDCFEQWRQRYADQMVLIMALQENEPVACALNLRIGDTLYGRYWGAIRFVTDLHFETCYVQAIDYCIGHGLAVFEGGAQGEHKLARGMLPEMLSSMHWIADARFAAAIDDFLARERQAIERYVAELKTHSPFKQEHG